MKSYLKIAAAGFVVTMFAGCANTQQIEKDISELKSQVSALSSKIDQANSRAASAESTARAAEDAANRAEQLAQDTNSKLDRMFKKSMMK